MLVVSTAQTWQDVSDRGHQALEDDQWVSKLPAGVELVTENGLYIGKWKYLSELVVAGRIFDEQGDAARR